MWSEYTIGILGGMGSYATLHFFSRILKAFPAEKEWERPRIVIDNRCTMPSRVRAYLYGEKRQELVEMMAESISILLRMGADTVILACNTAHLFLDEVKALLPETDRDKVINMIQMCADSLKREGNMARKFYLLATEGTIDSRIYQETFKLAGLEILCPCETEYPKMRRLIEAVKQNKITAPVKKEFLQMLKECSYQNIILGCTEFPVLYDAIREKLGGTEIHVFDPLETALSLFITQYKQKRSAEEQRVKEGKHDLYSNSCV